MRIEKRWPDILAPIFWTAVILFSLAFPAPGSHSAMAAAQAARTNVSDQKIEWTQFQDPFEKAFVVEVPKGWTVKGGLFRMGYSDERPMVDLVSPDRSINIRLGDVSIPSYTIPTQNHEREGEVYDLGAQARMIVARYRTGPQFAVLYSQARFAKTCSNPQPDRQDSDFSVPDYLPVDAAPAQASGGQTAFRCDSGPGARIAFAYTKTALAGVIWQAPTVASFLAPPDRITLVRGILIHCVQSFHPNPEWLEYQKRMDTEGLQYQRVRQQGRMANLQLQMQQFSAKMQAMQNQVNAFERSQNAQAAQVEGFTNILNGVTPTTDPLTGENRLVWTGPKDNYWVNGTGQVVNSHDAPAAGWRQLQAN